MHRDDSFAQLYRGNADTQNAVDTLFGLSPDSDPDESHDEKEPEQPAGVAPAPPSGILRRSASTGALLKVLRIKDKSSFSVRLSPSSTQRLFVYKMVHVGTAVAGRWCNKHFWCPLCRPQTSRSGTFWISVCACFLVALDDARRALGSVCVCVSRTWPSCSRVIGFWMCALLLFVVYCRPALDAASLLSVPVVHRRPPSERVRQAALQSLRREGLPPVAKRPQVRSSPLLLFSVIQQRSSNFVFLYAFSSFSVSSTRLKNVKILVNVSVG